MAIKTFKEIIDNKGYRISTKDREIFEEGTLQSFFGFSDSDMIEFIVYDANENQLPQGDDGKLVRYVPLSSENIKDYFLIADGTRLQAFQFPNEYFIDAERLINEAGYNNGIFKTQITLLNKRVGSEAISDSLWISEISPSRTEVRLLPLKRGLQLNPELKKRFDLFINNGEFRDDTINLAFNFIEKVNPSVIDNFLKSKYSTMCLYSTSSNVSFCLQLQNTITLYFPLFWQKLSSLLYRFFSMQYLRTLRPHLWHNPIALILQKAFS